MSGQGSELRQVAAPEVDTDRVFTVPNLLSMLRLALVPVFLWALLSHHDVLAIGLLMLSGITDYLDGKIARRFNLISRLGQLLDPAADRLYIISTLVALAIRSVIPWWLVVVLVLREIVVAGLYPSLRKHRLTIPPVHFVGKAATFTLLYAFPLLLFGAGDSTAHLVARAIGWSFAWWGIGLYWVGAAIYVWQVAHMVSGARAVERSRRDPAAGLAEGSL